MFKRNIKIILAHVPLIAALIIGSAQAACSQSAGTKVSSVRNNKLSDTSKINESFDVKALNDHLWIVEPVIRILPVSDTVETSGSLSEYNQGNESGTINVPGFRVQLYSTTDYYSAIRTRNEALTKFTEEIFLDFEQPYYKIRVGNFTDKQKADELRVVARSVGYPEAWVIQTKVTINK